MQNVNNTTIIINYVKKIITRELNVLETGEQFFDYFHEGLKLILVI